MSVRLDVPNRFYKMGFNKGRKQGAIEEIEFWNREIQRCDVLSDGNCEDFKQRLIDILNLRVEKVLKEGVEK